MWPLLPATSGLKELSTVSHACHDTTYETTVNKKKTMVINKYYNSGWIWTLCTPYQSNAPKKHFYVLKILHKQGLRVVTSDVNS